MNIFKVAKKSKYESLFSLKYSTIFELFQRSTSWHSGPKLKSVWVALFASTRTTSSSLIPLFLLHPSLCCSSNTTISLNRGPAVQRMCKMKTLFADLQCGWRAVGGGGWWAQLSYSGTSLVEARVRRCSPLVLPLLLSSARAWPGRTQARTFSTTRGKVSMSSFSSDYCKRVSPVKMAKVLFKC